jgi:hypothetical protein
MGRIAVYRACVLTVVVFGVVFASPSYVSASSLAGAPLAASLAPPQMPSATVSPLLAKELAVLTNQGISNANAWRAIDVQDKVARAHLPERLQTSLGDTYAGVWFTSATAQMHVGVVSPAGRRAAESVSARAGLTGAVAFTPVRSTVAQLLATQRKWNRKLANLFAREAVETGLEMSRNAVSIRLSSSLPSRQLATLKHEAADSPVNVFVSVSPSPQIGFSAEAKECSNFPEANCNPSITAGTLIWTKLKCSKVASTKGPLFFKTQKECEEEKVVGGEGEWQREEAITEEEEEAGTRPSKCTAGPAAIPEATKKARVLLTAGHCIQSGGGENVEWLAFTRGLTEPTIGKARRFVNGGLLKEKLGDFGEILIEGGGGWQTGKPGLPVRAVTAEWKKAEETRYRVKGERVPVEGATNCHEGKTSGEWCGQIKRLSLTIEYPPPLNTKEGLVEDEKAISEGGDSGGPWLFIETNNEVRMEGTHAGKRHFVPCVKSGKEGVGTEFFTTEAECNDYKTFREGAKGLWERKLYTYFEPLRQPVAGAGLGSLEALKLELLTTANERIEPEIAGKYPVKITTISGESKLETVGGRLVKCKASKGEGEISSATELKNTVIKYTGCKGKTAALGEAPCSSGATAEEIVTAKLKGTPVYLNKLKSEAAVLGEAQEAGATIAEFKCETTSKCGKQLTLKVKGTTLSALTPVNSSTTSLTLSSTQEKGKPSPSEYENEEGEKVKVKMEAKGEGFETFGYEEAGLEATHTVTAAEGVEVEA